MCLKTQLTDCYVIFQMTKKKYSEVAIPIYLSMGIGNICQLYLTNKQLALLCTLWKS